MSDPEHSDQFVRPRCPTILIAEDAVHVRRVCQMFFSERGFRVLEAANGEEAVTWYARHHPDVVLLDINMPVLDGIGALVRIRELDPYARVIMLTAQGEHDKVRAAIRAGARDYLLKPFTVLRVLQAVEDLLEGGRAQ